MAENKCDNCGAPLTLIEGRGYFHCAFCSTFHFPSDLESSQDGVIPLGQQHDAQCPICRVPLLEGALEDHHALYCENCRGVLVANDDFCKIVVGKRKKYTGPVDDPIPLNPDELNRKISCPSCEMEMDVHPYYGPGAIVIDSCGRCKIVWFDHGEIAAIERAPGRR